MFAKFDEIYDNFLDYKLGQGAQGSVFTVHRKNNNERVCLYAAKKYHNNIRDCYKREKIAYELLPSSDLLGTCVDSFDEGDQKYLILKLIEGKNFEHVIYKDATKKVYNTFEFNQIMKWASQMSYIIEMIQSKGMVYGDLHFKNIMMRQSSDLVLTDFGFCHLIHNDGSIDKEGASYKFVQQNILNFEQDGMKPEDIKNKIFEFHVKALATCFSELIQCFQGEHAQLLTFQQLINDMKGPERFRYDYTRPTLHEVKMRLREITLKINLDVDDYFKEQIPNEEPADPVDLETLRQQQVRQVILGMREGYDCDISSPLKKTRSPKKTPKKTTPFKITLMQ